MSNQSKALMTCSDCTHFDTTVHLAARDYHVGFCRKFSSTEYKIETACKAFLHTDLPAWDDLEPKTPLQMIAEAKAIQTYLNL